MLTLKRSIYLMGLVLIYLALVSCGVSEKPTAVPLLSPEPSLTPIVNLSLTTDAQNPSPSPTSILPDITSTPTILSTPLPTLLPEEAEQLIIRLLETNGDCKLPCWWGQIVPGKTRWENVNRFLQTFATKVRLNGEKNGLQLWTAYFTVPETIDPSKELIASIDVRDGIVEQLLVGQLYSLTDLLKDNGIPTDIRLKVSDDTFEAFSPWGRFTIALFWADKGILAVYEGRIDKTQPLNICMNKIEKKAPFFWLWDPARKKTMEEVGGELLLGTPSSLPKFHSLEEVINIDIETFYQTHSNPNNMNLCFKILDSFSP